MVSLACQYEDEDPSLLLSQKLESITSSDFKAVQWHVRGLSLLQEKSKRYVTRLVNSNVTERERDENLQGAGNQKKSNLNAITTNK